MTMNVYDIEDAVILLDRYGSDLPNARKAAAALLWLKNWTNWNSDGWPYWAKPRRASAKLQTLVQGAVKSVRVGDDIDITDANLAAALRPIKAFLTRQGVKPVDRPEILR